MLFFMGTASHLTTLIDAQNYGPYFLIVGLIILAVELNAFYGTDASKKPLSSVSGTIWSGFILTAVLYGIAELLL